LRISPREDNLLRAACLDSTRLLLNGEPFATDVIRPGDILGDGVYRWCWKGVERGFEPAQVGGFSVSASALSLEGRVRDFTASFRSGELAVVVGGSGSGKTTLVRMIAGILIPSSGAMTMQVQGESSSFPSEKLEDFAAQIAPYVSYIPQDDAVLAELTVRQAVEFAYLLHPSNRRKSRTSQALVERVLFLLQSTGLTEHADKLVERLSGGQRRRVNLALGLVGDPYLVILDEPTTGLDFANERRIMQLLRRTALQGRAVVVVTHSMRAIQFADRCVVVQPGPNGAEVAEEIKGRSRIIASAQTIVSLIAGKASQGAAPAAATRVRRTPRPRFIELVARGFRVWINTPTPALLAFVALPVLLGVMVRLGSGDFRKERLAIGLVAMFWLGINQSVRDLLKDLDVIRREDLDGTSPTRQILARACFSFATAAIGAIAMTAPLYWIKLDGWLLLPDPMGQFTERTIGAGYQTLLPWCITILAFWAAGLMGGLFGLATAAACSFARRKAEALAVLASVIITLPQFLFSEKCLSDGLARSPEHFNYFFKTWHSESEQAADLLSFLTVTRWTFLPLEAWMDGLNDTDIYRLSAITLGGGAIGSLIVASGLLSVSINVERGAGWLPRRRVRVKERRS
jgi:ABC-type multidrug transport system ATPase subunit